MNNGKIIKILQLAAFAVLLGRSWQHFYWDAPFRALLWDEKWMSWLFPVFETSWQDYITSSTADQWIQYSIQLHGVIYLIGALTALLIFRLPRWWNKWVLSICSLLLVLLAALYCKEKFFSLGQFFEYSLQFSSPLLLYFYLYHPEKEMQWIRWMRWATALTFACHGLYAINYYPRPGNFVEMTMNILPITEETTLQFLILAGVADFIVAFALLFLKGSALIPFIFYAFLWGLLTTFARIFAYIDLTFFTASTAQWLHESILRFPHFLIPLALLYFLTGKNKG